MTTHRMEKKIFTNHIRDLYSEYIKNSYKSIMKKEMRQFKNEQKISKKKNHTNDQ